jgi:hypothetical protein
MVARTAADSPLFIVWIRDVSARRVEKTESERRLAMLERASEVAGIGTYAGPLQGR